MLCFVQYRCKPSISYSKLTGGSRSNAQHSHQRIGKSNTSSYTRVSATPPPVNKSFAPSGGVGGNYQKAPRIGPGGRRMVKSFSQDAASSMASAATVAMNTLSSGIKIVLRPLCLDVLFTHCKYIPIV